MASSRPSLPLNPLDRMPHLVSTPMSKHGPSIVLGRSPRSTPSPWEAVTVRVSTAARVQPRAEVLQDHFKLSTEGVLAYALLRGLASLEREVSSAPTQDDHAPIPCGTWDDGGRP